MNLRLLIRLVPLAAAAALIAGCTHPQRSATHTIPPRREFPVNAEIDPCDDFFEYACSAVNNSFTLRDDRSRHIYSFSDSHERLLAAKQQYLAELTAQSNVSERAREISDYYQACMDAPARAAEERDEVRRIRRQVDDAGDRAAFQQLLADHILEPEFSFLSLNSPANPDSPEWLDVSLGAGHLMFLPERSYYERDQVLDDYRALAGTFFRTIGADQPARRADWLVDFECDFAQVYPRPAEWRELSVRKEWITRGTLLARYPNLRLSTVLSRIPERTRIRFYTPTYFAFLNQALGDRDPEALKSVYLFHALAPLLDDAYPGYFKKQFQFRHKHLGGPPSRSDRQERCTTLVMGDLRQELDAELVDVFFPGFDQARFEGLVDGVRRSMIERLQQNTWLSPEGRAAAITKMEATSMMLVKPKTEADWNFNYPADYQPDQPLLNGRLLSEKRLAKTLDRLQVPRNKNLWGMGPLTVNAYYSPPNNQFVMPVGILQYPFYDPDLPDHVNLGAVGVVVGHELGHAIDDKGSKYDAQGRLDPWMTAADLAEFERRTTKLVGQFDEVCYDAPEAAEPPVCHDGALTLGENIGDLTGLAFGYQTVRFSDDPQEARRQQREFFLQYARIWCGLMRPQERVRRLKVDPHALPEARVNQIVRHHPGFYEAYGCNANDGLYLPEADRAAPW